MIKENDYKTIKGIADELNNTISKLDEMPIRMYDELHLAIENLKAGAFKLDTIVHIHEPK